MDNIVKVLRKFREEEDPEMEEYDGKCLPTLSKAELTSIAKSKGVKLDELLLLGGIPDSRENMCKLVHFALQCADTIQEGKEDEEAGPSNRPDPPRKKRKTNDTTGMKALEDKIDKLEEMLEEKKTADDESDLERAKRDVKEEAFKGPKVDIDVLHERLVILESLARKQNSDIKDKINLILNRFNSHKSNPSFAAALVLKLVCNREEESILDKEQKLMKNFGLTKNNDDVNTQGYGMFQPMPYNYGYNRFSYPQGPSPPRFSQQPRRSRPRTPLICYRCNKPGRMARDCLIPPPQN
ncbi:unnamed protein product [Mytilus coruscus]|uniref:CCHC-type domain-containing protein n=1 Tax=Mytilus coruscus TaxID=42192 RepID=A0A6J8DX87_MYTCO|nr:unnamed protein product [Mytilus coruscus]